MQTRLSDPDGSGWEVTLGLFPEPVVGLRLTDEGAQQVLLRLTPARADELAELLARFASRARDAAA